MNLYRVTLTDPKRRNRNFVRKFVVQADNTHEAVYGYNTRMAVFTETQGGIEHDEYHNAPLEDEMHRLGMPLTDYELEDRNLTQTVTPLAEWLASVPGDAYELICVDYHQG